MVFALLAAAHEMAVMQQAPTQSLDLAHMSVSHFLEREEDDDDEGLGRWPGCCFNCRWPGLDVAGIDSLWFGY